MALRKNTGRRGQKVNENRVKLYLRLSGVVIFVFVAGFFAYKMSVEKKTPTNDNVITMDKVKEAITGKKPEPKKPKVQAFVSEVDAYLAGKDGTYGYSIIELDDGRTFGSGDEKQYRAASTIKVAIAAYIYKEIEKGDVNPSRELTYQAADYEAGTGVLQGYSYGTKFKVSLLLEKMITQSDNVATNILIRNFGRPNIQAFMKTNDLGEINIFENSVTPREMAKLLKLIYEGKIISGKNSKKLIGNMEGSIVKERLVAGVPAGTKVAHKIGSWPGAYSDIGIIYSPNRNYILAVYSKDVKGEGEVVNPIIAGISRKVFEFENSF